MQTLADIKTAVYALGYEDDQSARVTVLANSVQREILNDNRWRFAVVSANVPAVAGVAVYALPAAPPVHHIESVRLSTPGATYRELTATDSDDLLELAAYGGSDDGAQVWTELSTTTFQVYPAPQLAGTFTVRYLRTAPDLAADADVPLVPAEYLDIVVLGVAAYLAARERQWEAVDRFRTEKEKLMGRMKAQYGLKQRQSSARVAYSGQRQYGEY